MPPDDWRLCECDACTADGEEPPRLVSKRTWFRHQRIKRQRLSEGRVASGGLMGPAGSSTAVASTDVDSEDSTDVPPAAFVVEDPAADSALPIGPPEPVMQDAVSFNEVQLPVDQFGECAKDLALFTYAVNHGLSEEAFADLLKLSSCDANSSRRA
ncbi:hypothetical protein BU14_0014s0042 [Porphyra umbilicalis]|uniref:Uncharacterized protein n=1 Tax=Porphyra umbilicalis TaxID=2786 RepID=A0A1X6PL06_PORUM|nr:hypothetical protein BU14_0014s0042 [Porphyra umbilicalis]|eukprot:OSX81492.1 hypothetical protein BU14_0014s0042 [Porphyra umbilicalis]